MNLAAEQSCAFSHVLSFDLVVVSLSLSFALFIFWLCSCRRRQRCCGHFQFIALAVAALPLTQLFASVQVLPAAVGAVVCATAQVKLVVVAVVVETSSFISFWSCSIKFATFLCGTDQWAMGNGQAALGYPPHIVFNGGSVVICTKSVWFVDRARGQRREQGRAGRSAVGVWVLGSGAWIYAVYVILVGCQVLALYIVFLFTFYYYTLYPLKLLMQGVFEFR